MGILDGLMKQTNGVQAQMQVLQAAEQNTPFRQAVESIKALDKGFPALGVEAAQEYAKVSWVPVTSGSGLAGSGFLAAVTLMKPADVIAAAKELAEHYSQQPTIVPVATGLVPQEPSLPVVSGLLPPDAPEIATLAEPVVKKTRKKRVGTPLPGQIEPRPEVELPLQTAAPVAVVSANGDIRILVDCITNFDGVKSLDSYVTQLTEAICRIYSVPDIRCAVGDTELSFGKWRGVLNTAVKQNPPAPGTYMLDTRGREVSEVVADALVSVATFYVRGIR